MSKRIAIYARVRWTPPSAKVLASWERKVDKSAGVHPNGVAYHRYIGGKTSHGYGRFWNGSRLVGAHHFAWSLEHRRVIPKRLPIRHDCDTPDCVNPECLRLDTPAGNSADMVAKGRQARGERHGRVKLTRPKVREARHLYAEGMSVSEIASRFNIARSTMWHALDGETWKKN